MQSHKRPKWPWVIGICLIAAIALVFVFSAIRKKPAETTEYTQYTAQKGDVVSTVTGSGKLESADTEEISVPDGILVSGVTAKVGDEVKKGDTLATFDTESLADKAAEISETLSTIDTNMRALRSSKSVTSVYAPQSGRVKEIYAVQDGDIASTISESGALAILSSDGLMQVQIETADTLPLNADVTVNFDGGSEDGTVAEKKDDGYIILLPDDSAPVGGTAEVVYNDTTLGSGVLSVHAPIRVLATGGIIDDILVSVNDSVDSSTKMFSVTDGTLAASYRTLYSERIDAEKTLAEILAYQQNPAILSPADGVISQINLTEGSETGSSTGGANASVTDKETAFAVSTGGATQLVLSVDELDISSIAVGQDADILLDAFPNEHFDATVQHISRVGDTDKTITTFQVELTVSSDERLAAGMNASATITIAKKSDVLLIPVAAIYEDADGAYVLLGEAKVRREIVTGLSDGTYVEITDGLAEGDVIEYLQSSSSTSDSFKTSFGGTSSGSESGSGMRKQISGGA